MTDSFLYIAINEAVIEKIVNKQTNKHYLKRKSHLFEVFKNPVFENLVFENQEERI